MKSLFNSLSIESKVYWIAGVITWILSILVVFLPVKAVIWIVAGLLNTLSIIFAVLFVWHYLVGSSSFLHPLYDWTYRITGITRFKNLVEVYRSKDHGIKKS